MRRKPPILPWLLVVGGGFAIWVGVSKRTPDEKIAAYGVETNATVISKSEFVGKNSARAFQLKVRFETKDGRAVESLIEVDEAKFEDPPKTVTMQYLESDPTQNRWAEVPVPSKELLPIGVVFFSIGASLLVWKTYKRRREQDDAADALDSFAENESARTD